MGSSRISEAGYEGEVSALSVTKGRKASLLQALYLPIGVISGLVICTFPLSAPILYVVALLLFAK